MTLLTVKVTAAHIGSGARRIANRCPVALALSEATGEQWYVLRNCAGTISGPEIWFRLPEEAQEFVEDFDMGRPVEPFTFKGSAR